MNKLMWTTVGVVVAVFVGVAWTNDSQGTVSEYTGSGVPTAHITGPQNAQVKLVEYSDFQCPACAAYFPVVEQVVGKYKDQVSFEYRHYPLTTIHRNAFAAARASEAAGKQAKFWEMYRLLFANQSAWKDSGDPRPLFINYAKQLGLDRNRFTADFASSQTNNAINASVAEFNKRGLPQSTPTFLLNDKKIQPRTLEDFSKLIDKQLQATNAQ